MWEADDIPRWTAPVIIVLILDGIKLGLLAPFGLWWTAANRWRRRRQPLGVATQATA
ncbi:MAG: hypothetical protein FWF36_03215 [Propionibacteriaceae bacterium]|nr:hypothetical protein [Propionibacteriaceae bacterium]